MKAIHSTILFAILMLVNATLAWAETDEHATGATEHAAEGTHSEEDGGDHHEEDTHDKEEAHDEEGSHDEEESDHDEAGHDEEESGHGGHDEKKSDAELSGDQVKMASITVTELQPARVEYQINALGEIKNNGYRSYLVSARIPSIVLQRYVALGETVKQDQKLVTLFSDEVAEAQVAYRVAESEWKRVRVLGRQAVGDKRYIGAQSDVEALQGKLEAYGLSGADFHALSSGAKVRLGEYTLRAMAAGVVLSDDFHQGQRVDAGEAIMELADETELWVEARLPPGSALVVPLGTPALIKVGGESFSASVAQEAHNIDPESRTRIIRLVVDNSQHKLHSGLFADVAFQFTTPEPVMALPESAVLRGADGDWQVFVETAQGRYEPREVELLQTLGEHLVISGIASGSRVVTSGAFFVQSEIAKSGFEVHNH